MKISRFILTLFIALASLGLFGSGAALAHTLLPARPHTRVALMRPTITCGDCDTNDYWNEDNHGSSITMTVSGVLILGIKYQFYTVLTPKTQYDLYAYVGFEMNEGYCSLDSSRGVLFYRIVNQSGVVLKSGCFDGSSYTGDAMIEQINLVHLQWRWGPGLLERFYHWRAPV